MSNLLADPLFVRAEVDYRLEQWGTSAVGNHTRPARRTAVGLRRRLARWHRSPAATRRPVAVTRPRHP
jgi:hypothetical protein